MKYLLLLAILSLTIYSCKSQKPIVLDEYDGPKLTFGSGGGFAGRYISHSIFPNGEVYLSKNQSKSFNPTKSIDKDLAVQMINNYKTLGFDKISHNDPGNMTYFVSFEEKGEKHKLVWGGEQTAVPQELKSYFRTLSKLVKESKNPTK